jgi:hypothetical protein
LDEAAGSVKKTFDELKANIKAQLETAFAPIAAAWKDNILPALQEIQTSFDRLVETIDRLNEKFNIFGKMGSLIPPEFVENIGFAIGVLATLGITAGSISAIITLVSGIVSSSAFIIIGAVAAIKLAWDADLGGIRTTTEQAFGIVANWFGIIGNFLGSILPANIGISQQAWDTFMGVIIVVGQTILDFIMRVLFPLPYYIVEVEKGLRTAGEAAIVVVDWFKKMADGGFVQFFKDLNGAINDFGQFLGGLINKIPAWLTPGSPTPLELAFRGIAAALSILVGLLPKFSLPNFDLDGKKMIASVKGAFDDVYKAIKGFGDEAAAAWKIGVDLLVTHSTTMFAALVPVFVTGLVDVNEVVRVGLVDMLEIWRQGWQKLIDYIYNEAIPAIIAAVEELIRAAKQAMMNAVQNGGFDEVGAAMVESVALGVENSPATLIASFIAMISATVSNVKSQMHGYFYDLGYNMILAVVDGIWAAAPLLAAALNEALSKQTPSKYTPTPGYIPPSPLEPIASGGPVMAGQRYLAGESTFSRPETFVASQSGYMLTRQDAIEAVATSLMSPQMKAKLKSPDSSSAFRNSFSNTLTALQQYRSVSGSQGKESIAAQAAASRLRLMAHTMEQRMREPAVQNYNLSMTTRMEPQTVEQGFQVFKLMGSI